MLLHQEKRLNDADLLSAKRAFATEGFCSIQQPLDAEFCAALLAELIGSPQWSRTYHLNGKTYLIPLDGNDEEERQKDLLDTVLTEQVTDGFRYRYSVIKSPEDLIDAAPQHEGPALTKFRDLMLSADTLRVVEDITGAGKLTDIEWQTTRFNTGDFLSMHNDSPSDHAGRKVAYVLGLTEAWGPDWGGELVFPKDDSASLTIPPGFNRLDLFDVPQDHRVNAVTPSANAPRIAISGWFHGS